MITINCAHCGKEKRVKPGRPYCSRECANAAKTHPREHTVCERCGGGLPAKRNINVRFCSSKCALTVVAARGPAHYKWNGGRRSQRSRDAATVKAIDTQKKEVGACERCGAVDNLHCHHRLSYANHPELRADIDNLEVLCSDCHATEHPEIASLIRFPYPSRVSIVCVECGTEIKVKPSHAKMRKLCSVQCRALALSKRMVGNTYCMSRRWRPKTTPHHQILCPEPGQACSGWCRWCGSAAKCECSARASSSWSWHRSPQ